MENFPLIDKVQFLSIHFCIDLGDGHSPVNYPMRLCFARDSAALRGRARGREISGISSNLLTNLVTDGLFFGGPIAEMREANKFVESSGS